MTKNKDGFEAGQELTFEQVQEVSRKAKAKVEKKHAPKAKAD
jgi:hypothetical protein